MTVTTREGRLYVKLRRRFRKWKERHFRLSTRTWDDGRDVGPCLSMFVKSKNTFKLIVLDGCEAAPTDDKRTRKRFGFSVRAPADDDAYSYEFYAKTAGDRDAWIADINDAIASGTGDQAVAAARRRARAAAADDDDEDDDGSSVAATDLTDSSFVSINLGGFAKAG